MYSLTLGGKATVLYNFGASAINDGTSPFGSLINVGGTFYGTTDAGGNLDAGQYTEGCGTVFSLTAAGVETVLYAFQSNNSYLDGCNPHGALTEIGARFYGTTSAGGAYSAGTVFSISR